jgi:hypothetical protein
MGNAASSLGGWNPVPVPKKKDEYCVEGFARRVNGKSISDQRVRAYDIDLRSRQLLGECTTDCNGHYIITYTAAQFRRAEKGTADIRIVAVDTCGENELAASSIYFNAGQKASIDVVIGGSEVRGLSEFEALLEAIKPVLDGVEVAYLVEDADHQDLSFLVGETGVDRDQLQLLITAHATSSQTGVDARFFYGLFRKEFPTDLALLLQVQRDELLAALQSAATDNIIALSEDEMTAMVDKFVQKAVDTASGQSGSPMPTSKASQVLKDAIPQLTPVLDAFSKADSTESFWESLSSNPQTKDHVADIQKYIQFGTITLNHQPLVDKLIQNTTEIKKFEDLAKYREADWLKMIQTANVGVPDEIPGDDAADKARVYATSVARLVEEAIPTDFLRNRLVDADDIATFDGKYGKSDLVTFLSNNPTFNMNGARISQANPDTFHFGNVQDRDTLVSNVGKLQRLYTVASRYDQVRPLLGDGIHSALQIARIGRTKFTAKYASLLGSPREAEQVYDRAHYTHSAALNLITQFRTRGLTFNWPVLIDPGRRLHANPPKEIPDWKELFGSIDSCTCDDCQALDSPAAYFVDILHFLRDRVDGVKISQSVANAKDVLFLRRPDLGEIELTCANTKTPLPYIDLANEILENAVKAPGKFAPFDLPSAVIPFLKNNRIEDLKNIFTLPLIDPKITVVEKGERWRIDEPSFSYSLEILASDAGVHVASRSRQTTGTPQDLAAMPQYINMDAYDVLAKVVHPLSLPLDLPLLTVKTYLKHLGVDRYSLMEVFNTDGYRRMLENEDIAIVLLGISPEQAKIISGIVISQDGSATPGEWNLWGFSTEILNASSAISDPASKMSRIHDGKWVDVLTGRVDVFLQQSALKYLDLLNVLEISSLIRLDGQPTIQPFDGAPVDTCLLNQLLIKGMASRDLHRILCFIRLWKALGTWSMLDLARAYLQFESRSAVASFNIRFLIYVSQLERIRRSLDLPIDAILAFFGDLDTQIRVDNTVSDDTTTPTSQFDQIFNSNAVTGQNEFKITDGVSSGSLDDHIPGLTAALNISSGELSLLLGNPNVLETPDVSVTNLTTLYRHTILAKALNVPMSDYLLMMKFVDVDPFATSIATLDFTRRSNSVLASGFSLTELDYLLAQSYTPGSSVRPDDITIGSIMDSLRGNLQKIATDNTLQPDKIDQKGDLLKAKLAVLSWESEVVTELVSVLNNTASFTVTFQAATTPIEAIFPPNQLATYPVSQELQSRFSFDAATQKLTVRGAMTLDEKTALLSTAAGLSQQVLDGIAVLFEAPRKFLSRNALTFDIKEFNAPLAALPPDVIIPIALRQKVYFDAENLLLKSNGVLSESQRDALLEGSPTQDPSNAYIVAVTALFSAPDAPPTSPVVNPFLSGADVVGLFDADVDRGEANTPFRRFKYVLERLLPYVLNTQSDEAVTHVLVQNLGLDSQSTNFLLDEKKPPSTDPLRNVFRDPTFTQMSLKLPSSRALFPIQYQMFELLYKMAMVASRLRLTATQLTWIFEFRKLPGDPTTGWLNLFDLPLQAVDDPRVIFVGWERLIALTNLRDNTPGGEATLDTVFAIARAPNPNIDILLKPIIDQTKLSTTDLAYLTGSQGFNLQVPGDFKDEIALSRLFKCLRLVQMIGCSAADAQSLSQSSLDFKSSQTAIQAIKSRYDQDTWNAVARPLRNILRESQRQALVDYLTSRNLSQGQLFLDANDLFSYYLIDVEMGPCQMTSRLKQAICSVQLFAQRCFLNLEPDVTADADADPVWNEWSWMKYENVHAANYQILMNPENYMEPELRDDQTDFFQEFRSDIQQTEIDDDAATSAFSNYLDKLDGVSRLEVVSFYHEQETLAITGNLSRDIVHIIARTRGQRPLYYYRQRVDSFAWKGGWTRIDADLEGDHILPIVWNRKLFLFWLSFHQKQDSSDIVMPQPGQTVTHNDSYLATSLCWSVLSGDKFSAKKMSPVAYNLYYNSSTSDITVKCAVEADGGALEVQVVWARKRLAVFRFTGVNGSPTVRTRRRVTTAPPGTKFFNMSFQEDTTTSHDALSLSTAQASNLKVLAQTPGSPYELVCAPQDVSFVSQRPFFFQHDQKSYFVNPISRTRLPIYLPTPILIDPSWMEGSLISKQIGILKPVLPVWQKPFPDPVYAGRPKGLQSVALNQGQLSDFLPDDGAAVGPLLNTQSLIPLNSSLISLNNNLLNPILNANRIPIWSSLHFHTAYKFSLFYHPFVKDFIAALNRDGLDGLLDRPVQLLGENKNTFADTYKPTFFVAPDDAGRYAEDVVDFEDGAYAVYNWELFFHIPLMIADRLSKNQRFQEAQKWFHFIFDPTNTSPLGSPERFWITKKFFENTRATYADETLTNLFRFLASRGDPAVLNTLNAAERAALTELEASIAEWRKDPFKPFLIARTRTTAFQKMVVMKYLDNLIAWGDSLFRGNTIEKINEATQVYVLAAQILGDRPVEIPARAVPKMQTYNTLEPHLDAVSNALVPVEELVPAPTIDTPIVTSGPSTAVQPSMLFFCIPRNDKLLSYWDTVEDRLFKIRHCMNLQGIVQQLPLFDPPIDPMLLVKAAASGVDINTALSDINAPLPHYRFQTMLQRAVDVCNELKALGSALMAALEKRDAEGLALLRSSHEMNMNTVIKIVKEKQVDEAAGNAEALRRGKNTIQTKYNHYTSLSFMNEWEAAAMGLESGILLGLVIEAVALATAGGIFIIPDIKVGCPTTIGATLGGGNFGKACEMFAAFMHNTTAAIKQSTGMLATLGSYKHRQDDWDLQTNIADGELKQFDSQIATADIRKAIAEQEVTNHENQTANTKEVDDFMRSKFSNSDLYDWTIGRLSMLYFQSYQLAYDTAKRAERAYRYEIGTDSTSFVQFGYWDSLKKGLLAGEMLYHDLKQMELSYLDQDVREYEITSSISLAQLDPLALIQLRQNGDAFFSLPEALFDVRFPGHYFRRIKSVSLTIPCVVGPYVNVNATLSLLKDSIRTSPLLSSNKYARSGPNDTRFRDSYGQSQSIVTSSGQNDSGLFDPGTRDERYVPFERCGAVSSWRIQLPVLFKQFDYDAMTDVVLQVRYTAREGGDALRDAVQTELRSTLLNSIQLAEQNNGLARLISLRHEPRGLYQFLARQTADGTAETTIDLSRERFPFVFYDATAITISRVQLMVFVNKEFQDKYTAATLQFWLQEPPRPLAASGSPTTTTPPPEGPALQLAPWFAGLRASKDFKKELQGLQLKGKLVSGAKLDPNAIDDIMLVMYYSAKWT